MSKAKYRVKNWSEYNKALKQRGSVTFWLDEKAIAQWWHDTPNGKRGRDLTYSDQAIVTFMMLQAGLVEQIAELSQLALIRSPNHADTRHRNEQSKIPS
ncbi:transposase [Idiomarina zobellii]|uniref:Transposase DDE domain-containing protein n=1 Tax=Idiomarina zobellii TaxID=86103 RepID=A0A837NDS3_9GAMM|nr:transposase [Idiomarina zobellii]KPD23266.1 hypothetical protein AFK76_09600 [Idiomarina zobellii]